MPQEVPAPEQKTFNASQALVDAKALNDNFTNVGADETYKKLMTCVEDAKASTATEDEKLAYFTTLGQQLDKQKVLPSLSITYLDKKAPKDAKGEIVLNNGTNDGKDLDQELARLSDITTFKKPTKANPDPNKYYDPSQLVEKYLCQTARSQFPTFAKAADGNGSSISKADLAKLLQDQPKRKP